MFSFAASINPGNRLSRNVEHSFINGFTNLIVVDEN